MGKRDGEYWAAIDDVISRLSAKTKISMERASEVLRPQWERFLAAKSEAETLFEQLRETDLDECVNYVKATPPTPEAIGALIYVAHNQLRKEERSERGKHAADGLHDKPGGSRDKGRAIKDAWASGKYSSRDICAEQECAALNMSFSAARKALRNTPKPT